MIGIALIISNLILSIIIFGIGIKVYQVYRRKYLFWFLVSLFLIPMLFLYSLIEIYNSSIYMALLYPFFIILIEISVIFAQKNLLSSLRTEEGKEYRMLLKEDIALIRAFEKVSNYLIRKISPLIGIKSIEDLLEDASEKYEFLKNCYIGIDERLETNLLEEKIDIKGIKIEKLSEGFSYLLIKLIDLYAAFVPYEKILEEMRKEIGKIDKRIVKFFIPFSLFKLIIEPIIRKCKGDEIKEIRIAADIEGIYINKNGGIEFYELYRYEDDKIQMKFLKFLERCYPFLIRYFGNSFYEEITKNFRALPSNVKEEIYKHGFIKSLPKGVLEEEKITLMSREKLIKELIDRKKKLEEAYKRLAEAKLDKMKSKFIDIIAHELKTPLTAIKTYNDLLMKEKLGKLNKLQKEKLGKMAKNIDKLTNLINDMLQIPTIDTKELELRKEVFYVEEIIKNIVEEVEGIAREKRQVLKYDVDSIAIEGDKKMLEKAIKNIVTNAIKYTREGGKILIKAKKDGKFAHIYIQDNGIGIEKKELEKIFEPFYTGDGGGVGLGLAIAKNIVESHDGKIWAESKVGKGSTFHVILRRIE